MSSKYRTLVADPPWDFQWHGGPGGRRHSDPDPQSSEACDRCGGPSDRPGSMVSDPPGLIGKPCNNFAFHLGHMKHNPYPVPIPESTPPSESPDVKATPPDFKADLVPTEGDPVTDPGKVLQDQANIDLLRASLSEHQRVLEAVREWAEDIETDGIDLDAELSMRARCAREVLSLLPDKEGGE